MLRSGIYNIAGEVFRKGLALAAIPLIIRQVGVAEYGVFTAASAAIGLLSVAEWGLSFASTVIFSKDIASRDRVRVSQSATIFLIATAALGVALSLILFLISDAAAGMLSENSLTTVLLGRREVLAQALRIGSFWIGARLLQQVFVGIQQARGRYGVMNVLTSIQSAAANIGIIVVAMQGGRTVAMIQWQTAVGLAAMLVHGVVGWSLLKELSPQWMWSAARFREIAAQTIWTCLTTLGSAIFSQADRLIVFRILGDSAAGTYGAMTLVTSQINTFSALPVQPLLPDMSERLSQAQIDLQSLSGRIKQAFQVNALTALWLGLAMFALAPEILLVMLKKQDAALVLSFRVAVVIYSIYSLNGASYYLLLAAGEVKSTTYIVLGCAVASIVLIGVGATQFQLLGAISGNAGYLGIGLLTLLALKRMAVPMKIWIGWLQFPVGWFVGAVTVSAFFAEQLPLRAAIFAIATLLLIGWLFAFEKTIAPALLNAAGSRLEKP